MSSAIGKLLVVSHDGENTIGVVEFGGKRRSVYLTLVPNARSGDFVRFRAGFATEKVEGAENLNPENRVEDKDREIDIETLRAYRLLSALDPRCLQKLLPLAQEQTFAAGQTIFHAGETSVYLHLIVSGIVVLEEPASDGAVPVQTLGAGDALGWSALTTEARTHFDARAVSDVVTVAFEGGPVRVSCDADPVMGYALMKQLLAMMTERLDALRMKVVAVAPIRSARAAG